MFHLINSIYLITIRNILPAVQDPPFSFQHRMPMEYFGANDIAILVQWVLKS